MSWDHVIGHDDLKRVLSRSLSLPAPGYLFFGPGGIGKTALAEGFARALLDHPAEKTLASHPDFLVLERDPQSKQIGVETVRDLVSQMHTSPALGKRRVALIHEADTLNGSASNSLLKAVEEPKANNVYLFTAISFERIPLTLRSRLVGLRMRPRTTSDLASWLREFGAADAERIAALSGGCPGRAKRMVTDASLWNERVRLAEETLDACAGATGARFEALLKLKKIADKDENPVEAWKEMLTLMMRLARERLKEPTRFAEVAEGLILAWHEVGGAVSPEVMLEWTAVRTSFINKVRYTPSFLYPRYL